MDLHIRDIKHSSKPMWSNSYICAKTSLNAKRGGSHCIRMWKIWSHHSHSAYDFLYVKGYNLLYCYFKSKLSNVASQYLKNIFCSICLCLQTQLKIYLNMHDRKKINWFIMPIKFIMLFTRATGASFCDDIWTCPNVTLSLKVVNKMGREASFQWNQNNLSPRRRRVSPAIFLRLVYAVIPCQCKLTDGWIYKFI